FYGDELTVSASDGAAACQQIDLAAGRVVAVDSVLVGRSGAATPRAWLELWAETSPSSNSAVATEMDIPLRSAGGSFTTFSGQLQGGFPIVGGSEFSADGRPARVS